MEAHPRHQAVRLVANHPRPALRHPDPLARQQGSNGARRAGTAGRVVTRYLPVAKVVCGAAPCQPLAGMLPASMRARCRRGEMRHVGVAHPGSERAHHEKRAREGALAKRGGPAYLLTTRTISRHLFE